MGQTRRSYLFTIARAGKIGATKIRHLCGNCATIIQSAARAASQKNIGLDAGRCEILGEEKVLRAARARNSATVTAIWRRRGSAGELFEYLHFRFGEVLAARGDQHRAPWVPALAGAGEFLVTSVSIG